MKKQPVETINLFSSIFYKVYDISRGKKIPSVISYKNQTFKFNKYGNTLIYFFELNQPEIEETFQLRFRDESFSLEKTIGVTILGVNETKKLELKTIGNVFYTKNSVLDWTLIGAKMNLFTPPRVTDQIKHIQ